MKSEIQIDNNAGVCQIDIEGTIGVPEEWQFDRPEARVATYEKFRDAVRRIAEIDASEVVVNIRSTGGDVNDALLIHDALRQLQHAFRHRRRIQSSCGAAVGPRLYERDPGRHYREIANVMDEARAMYTEEIGTLPGFKVYKSIANFILIKYPIELKEALEAEFASQSYKVKFMNEPDINTHMRITLGRREQNRLVCDVIKRIALNNK